MARGQALPHVACQTRALVSSVIGAKRGHWRSKVFLVFAFFGVGKETHRESTGSGMSTVLEAHVMLFKEISIFIMIFAK